MIDAIGGGAFGIRIRQEIAFLPYFLGFWPLFGLLAATNIKGDSRKLRENRIARGVTIGGVSTMGVYKWMKPNA